MKKRTFRKETVRKCGRSAVSAALVCALLGTCVSFFAAAKEETFYDTDLIPIEVVRTAHGGMEDYTLYFEDGEKVDLNADAEPVVRAAAALPSAYDSRDRGRVTSVKNQGRGGTCWAFAAISTIESDYISKGYGTSSVDFSEDHHVWFTHKMDPLYGDGPVSLAANTDSNHGAYVGSSWLDTTASLVNWWGLELDSNAPYDPYNMNNNGNLPESQRTVSYAHLQGTAIEAQYNEDVWTRMNDLKTVVMERGACQINFWMDEDNSNNGYYYQDENKEPSTINHAVSIVGWDDRCSRTNFRSKTGGQPSGDGAWLVKNSWGNHPATQNGYLWISYYDNSLSTAMSFDVEPATNYDHIYGYTGYGPNTSNFLLNSNTVQYANIFKAGSAEELKAVGLWAMQDNLDYTVNIYKGLSASATSPTSGTLVSACKTTGNLPRRGYYTVDLTNGVQLSADEQYAVVVSITAKSHQYLVYPFENAPWSGSAYSVTYSSKKGESYIYRNSKWYDSKNYTATTLNNALINAYTKDTVHGDFEYTVDTNGEATITGYNGEDAALHIPSSIDGHTVTAIGTRALMYAANRDNVETVVIPETVRSIGDNAFTYCSSLRHAAHSATVPR